jgi:N-acetylglucosamine malate deacetylase 1
MNSKAEMESHKALLALGAHPDDIEFGCGAVIARETAGGRKCHFAIVTRGESATHGTPAQRAREAAAGAKILGASLQFLPLAKDARLKPRTEHALKLAAHIRKVKPGILLAPTLVKNQHPDHFALGNLAQMAARLARYGGIKDHALQKLPPHAIDLLLFYAVSPDAEPKDAQPILIDISATDILDQWTHAMNAHASQMKTRNYVELQLTRARLNGLRAGIGHAAALFPNDPLVIKSLSPFAGSARAF